GFVLLLDAWLGPLRLVADGSLHGPGLPARLVLAAEETTAAAYGLRADASLDRPRQESLATGRGAGQGGRQAGRGEVYRRVLLPGHGPGNGPGIGHVLPPRRQGSGRRFDRAGNPGD